MPLTDIQRKQITDVAMGWCRTPFRSHSALKGCGCDCGGLIRGVFIEAGIQPKEGYQIPEYYSLQATQHKPDSTYRDVVEQYMREIPESQARPGDVVMYQLQGHLEYGHAGIIVSWPDFVLHATFRHGVAGGHGTKDPLFRFGKKKFYTLKEEFVPVEVES